MSWCFQCWPTCVCSRVRSHTCTPLHAGCAEASLEVCTAHGEQLCHRAVSVLCAEQGVRDEGPRGHTQRMFVE